MGKDTVAFIYQPIGCHSYNILIQQSQKIKIATIDTMLSFYLAFLYAGEPYYDNDRILCMSKFLFDVQQKNRLSQKGLLKRFSIVCYGHQESVEEMKSMKAKKNHRIEKQKRHARIR
ncbi:putative polyA polymerase catalytic subunit [Yellowstone lake mimivirus]|uniref:putative polyA polymerase catalytic subunit n=1 Tax=Yellowstone lake mimivirus TaxID=1586712 RepID=UPI0006EBA61A|nr:putative polyA polymerase catalytic subunit [Yellowstone lake mimivirus]BAT21998.1 putative polyA polymerase catalytic subunit [Yellowstone lake mimivirus]